MSEPTLGWTWSRLGGALGASLDAKALLLALASVLLLKLGWSVLDSSFEAPMRGPRVDLAAELPVSAWRNLFNAPVESSLRAGSRLTWPALAVIGPWTEVFRFGVDDRGWIHAALAGCWSLLILSTLGGAIARIHVVRAVDEADGIGLLSSLVFALRHATALVAAPLAPLAATALLAVPCLAWGLVARFETPASNVIVDVLGFVPLVFGLAMAALLIGLAAGWPLMVLTVAAEGEDGFDAVSRSFSYLGHRPLQFLTMLACAVVVGLVGIMAIDLAAELAVGLARWGVHFGTPDLLADGLFGEGGRARVWGGLLAWSLAAWPLSYFWAAFSRIYLALRREVDGTPWDDYFRPDRDPGLDFLAAESGPGKPAG